MNDNALSRTRRAAGRSVARGLGAGIPLGRLVGAPVRLSPTWLLLAALVTYAYGQVIAAGRPWLPAAVGYAVGFAFVVCLVGSVLLHELGHALTSRGFGIGVRGITLEALGGYTEMERQPSRPSVEIAVSMAGPLVSLALGIAAVTAALVLPAGTLARQLASQLAFGNLVIAVFNALPGLPLDGGRALQAVVWAVTGDPGRGRRVAGMAGRAIAVGTALIGLQLFLAGRIWVVGLVMALIVAQTIWTGAGGAVRAAAVAEQVDRFDVAALARPILAVAPGTPLSQAWRRAEQVGGGGLAEPVIAVADPQGQVLGLLHAAAAAAVPADRRDWITVDSLIRTVEPEHVVALRLHGVDLLRAVSAAPDADYLVVDDDDVVGVLRGSDLSALLESTGLVSGGPGSRGPAGGTPDTRRNTS